MDYDILYFLLSGVRVHDGTDAQLSVSGLYELAGSEASQCQYT